MDPIIIKKPDERYCADCGKVIHQRAEICPFCGCRQISYPFFYSRNRIIASFLAIFAGTFGAHKFYLGKVGIGVLYLIFFWTCIPTIISIVEGLIYLSMSDTNFNQKYANKL